MGLVRVERRDRVAILTLDDPDRRNALSRALVDHIVAAVDELEADDTVGALVVTGAPPAFCAGADLGVLASQSPSGPFPGAPAGTSGSGGVGSGRAAGDDLDDSSAEEGLRAIYEGFLRVARCTLPTVAAVNGPAVGAGLNMAMGCDVRVAAESAVFDSRFLALGLHPGGGGTWLLHRAIGPEATAALSLFGERLDGRRAVEVGLAWRCVVDDEVLDAAVDLARPASDAPRELVIRLKAALRGWDAVDSHDDAVAAELGPQIWSIRQPEFRARIEALRRKIESG